MIAIQNSEEENFDFVKSDKNKNIWFTKVIFIGGLFLGIIGGIIFSNSEYFSKESLAQLFTNYNPREYIDLNRDITNNIETEIKKDILISESDKLFIPNNKNSFNNSIIKTSILPLSKNNSQLVLESNNIQKFVCNPHSTLTANEELIKISEIAWMGTIKKPEEQWLELFNPEDETIDMSKWLLYDLVNNTELKFNKSSKITSKNYFLIGRGEKVNGKTIQLKMPNVFSREGTYLRLLNENCEVVVEFDARGKWPAGNEFTRATLEFDNDFKSVHTSLIVGGTPKAKNTIISNFKSSNSNISGTNSNTPLPIIIEDSLIDEEDKPDFKILISEIRAGSDFSSNDEFIELYNPNSLPVSLDGFELRKRSSSGSESNLVDDAAFIGTIPAYGFFLITHKDYVGNVSPDLNYSTVSANLAYSNNSILLYSSDYSEGTILDEVIYTEILKNSSIERKALVNGYCVSPTNENSEKGNACDTDNLSDFISKNLSEPQNSLSISEY